MRVRIECPAAAALVCVVTLTILSTSFASLCVPSCHQIPQAIRRIIAADAILVRIHFQNVFRLVWIADARESLLPSCLFTASLSYAILNPVHVLAAR